MRISLATVAADTTAHEGRRQYDNSDSGNDNMPLLVTVGDRLELGADRSDTAATNDSEAR